MNDNLEEMNFNELLKDAICNTDIEFLEENSSQYDINTRFKDEDNDSLLLYAISDEGSACYKYFLEKGADVKLTNDEGEGILHAIVYSSDVVRLSYILENYQLNIDSRTNDGATALLLALSLNKADIANVLLHFGADVNIADNEGLAPLHLAVQIPNLLLVKKMIDIGANPIAKTVKGSVPMAFAANLGDVQMIKYFYENHYIKLV